MILQQQMESAGVDESKEQAFTGNTGAFSQALRMLWKTGNQTVKKSVKQAVLEKVEEANSLFSTDKSKKSMKSSKK